jgi:hypothetical protein
LESLRACEHIDCSALLEQQQTADHDEDPWLRPHLRKVSVLHTCSVLLHCHRRSCRVFNARLGSLNPHALVRRCAYVGEMRAPCHGHWRYMGAVDRLGRCVCQLVGEHGAVAGRSGGPHLEPWRRVSHEPLDQHGRVPGAGHTLAASSTTPQHCCDAATSERSLPGITQWRDQKAILMQLLEMPGVERIRHVKVLPRECGHLLQV